MTWTPDGESLAADQTQPATFGEAKGSDDVQALRQAFVARLEVR